MTTDARRNGQLHYLSRLILSYALEEPFKIRQGWGSV